MPTHLPTPLYLLSVAEAKSVTQINPMLHVVLDFKSNNVITALKLHGKNTVLTWVKPKTPSDNSIKRPNLSSTLMTVASSMISPIA